MLFQRADASVFKAGQMITWGSGSIRAKIIELKSGNVKLELMSEATDPVSGKVFKPGYVDHLPIEIIRHLS